MKTLTTVLILFLIATFAPAQEKSPKNQITDFSKSSEVKALDDKFSGKRRVELKDLKISEQLTLSLDATVDIKKPANSLQLSNEFTDFVFVSTTGKREYGNLENRFDFIVDGDSVKGNDARSSATTDSFHLDKKEQVYGRMDMNRLIKVAKGKKVQLKIGSSIFDLSPEVLNKFKEFVTAVRL